MLLFYLRLSHLVYYLPQLHQIVEARNVQLSIVYYDWYQMTLT